MLVLLGRLLKAERAAVAPTVALSLFALIASGGIAFDYARLATMDTELQQAADQAALAAATQLDRTDDSQTHATTAITDGDHANRLSTNITKFANDSLGADIDIDQIRFCSAFDDGNPDTTAACTETTDGTETRYVVVTTSARTANYAFTPIVAALKGTVTATAVAGIASSVCNVAPLLVCVGNLDFPTDADVGKGIILKVAGGNSWAPGNYGYLDFGNGNQAVLNALMGQGLNGCQDTDDNSTEPGNKNATDAINTRMDVYSGSGATKDASVCDLTTGNGCPADNTRKDMVLTMTYQIQQATSLGQPSAGSVPNCGAAATSKTANPSTQYGTSFQLDPGATPPAAGFPRDTCHYTSCTDGNFGDGVWDLSTYLATNHPGVTASQIRTALGLDAGASLTRYNIYTWELANKSSGAMDPVQAGTTDVKSKAQGPNTTWTFTKQCTFSKPQLASSAYPAQKDRRLLPVVAADCSKLKGKGSAFVDYTLLRVFDIFLTEPSENRTAPAGKTTGTDDKEIYGEVVGPAQTFGGGGGFQYYTRNKPYLVR